MILGMNMAREHRKGLLQNDSEESSCNSLFSRRNPYKHGENMENHEEVGTAKQDVCIHVTLAYAVFKIYAIFTSKSCVPVRFSFRFVCNLRMLKAKASSAI